MTCLRVTGFLNREGLCIPIQAVQQFRIPRIVSEMGGLIMIFSIGDGNPINVSSQGLIPRHFWIWLEERRWLLLATLFPETTWNPFSASCHRSVFKLHFYSANSGVAFLLTGFVLFMHDFYFFFLQMV